MKIEKAKEPDIPEICQLNKPLGKLANWPYKSEYIMDFFTWPDKSYYIIKYNGRIIAGMGINGFGEIEILCVVKEWRHRGLGTQLVNFAIDLAMKDGLFAVYVGTYDDYKAVNFYKKLGFEIQLEGVDCNNFQPYTDLIKRIA